jgi:hypothetical protein
MDAKRINPVWISSFARSGNTLFRKILNHCFGVGSTSFYEEDKIGSMPGADMNFMKSHEDPMRLLGSGVYIMRDGRDVMVSLAHYRIKFHPADANRRFSDVLTECVEEIGGGTWSHHVLQGINRKFPIIKYEAMVKDPSESVRRVCSKIYDMDICFRGAYPLPKFQTFHHDSPDFYRKGVVGCWREEMPESINQRFMDLHGETMRQAGYL